MIKNTMMKNNNNPSYHNSVEELLKQHDHYLKEAIENPDHGGDAYLKAQYFLALVNVKNTGFSPTNKIIREAERYHRRGDISRAYNLIMKLIPR